MKCLIGKFSIETISIGTELLGAFQAKRLPFGRRETSISVKAPKYIQLLGQKAGLCPKKKSCGGCPPIRGEHENSPREVAVRDRLPRSASSGRSLRLTAVRVMS